MVVISVSPSFFRKEIMTEEFTNKDDANKIKKLLGLSGDETEIGKDKGLYYNVSDVLIALMHFCDFAQELDPDDDWNQDFETHLISAREGYEQNKRKEKYD